MPGGPPAPHEAAAITPPPPARKDAQGRSGMSKAQPSVQELIDQPNWQQERRMLRSLALEGGLQEAVKWGKLCYQRDGANVAIIYGLKHYCALGFFKGALMPDDAGLLVAPGDHSQAMRQLRFTDLQSIVDSEQTIRAHIEQAIQIESDGLKVSFDEKADIAHPEELLEHFEADPEFRSAFERLTPGRKRAHILKYAQAKQSATRKSRIARSRDNVLAGRGPEGR